VITQAFLGRCRDIHAGRYGKVEAALKLMTPAVVMITLSVPPITPGREILESKNPGERGVTIESPEPSREDLFA